jgi:hypothetical protein
MSKTNKAITKLLAISWLKDNMLAGFIGVLIVGILTIFAFNTDLSASIEEAVVAFSINTPDKYSPTDTYVIARLLDGKTIPVYLPSGWIPPTAGQRVSVKRTRRLFFGERFVLLRNQKIQTP